MHQSLGFPLPGNRQVGFQDLEFMLMELSLAENVGQRSTYTLTHCSWGLWIRLTWSCWVVQWRDFRRLTSRRPARAHREMVQQHPTNLPSPLIHRCPGPRCVRRLFRNMALPGIPDAVAPKYASCLGTRRAARIRLPRETHILLL